MKFIDASANDIVEIFQVFVSEFCHLSSCPLLLPICH